VKACAIINKKIRVLVLFNSDPELTKLFDKRPTDDTKTFINILLKYYINNSDNVLNFIYVIELYDIYRVLESGRREYMFCPDENLTIDISKFTEEDYPELSVYRSPLMYSLILQDSVLIDKLFNASLLELQYSRDKPIKWIDLKLKHFIDTYLHAMIYCLLRIGKYSYSVIIDTLTKCITKLLGLTKLYPTFTNLYLYLNFLKKSIGGGDLPDIISRDLYYTELKYMRWGPDFDTDKEVFKIFNAKFEFEYRDYFSGKQKIPEITELDTDNSGGYFDIALNFHFN